MSTMLTISDDLAALVEARRRATGEESIDAAAEMLIARGLIADSVEDDSDGWSEDELRTLIKEAEASGSPEPWDPAAVRAEVLRRYAALRGA